MALRYGGLVAGLALLVLAGLGGWQGWRWYQQREATQSAAIFLEQHRAAEAQGADLRAIGDRFAGLASSGPEGYRILSALRAAALKAETGDRDGALALWNQLSADNAAPRIYRDLASLMWALHGIDSQDPAQLSARLGPLAAEGSAWRASARELQGGCWRSARATRPLPSVNSTRWPRMSPRRRACASAPAGWPQDWGCDAGQSLDTACGAARRRGAAERLRHSRHVRGKQGPPAGRAPLDPGRAAPVGGRCVAGRPAPGPAAPHRARGLAATRRRPRPCHRPQRARRPARPGLARLGRHRQLLSPPPDQRPGHRRRHGLRGRCLWRGLGLRPRLRRPPLALRHAPREG
ncbi:tetratricopeptide repeat protein [Pseudoroseomonas cervicalis]|uniref:tetratricopeptide repeat protein n=1 Tax=Teichococcus cervicalis TaxID=204525 RepID=UPI0035EA1A86